MHHTRNNIIVGLHPCDGSYENDVQFSTITCMNSFWHTNSSDITKVQHQQKTNAKNKNLIKITTKIAITGYSTKRPNTIMA